MSFLGLLVIFYAIRFPYSGARVLSPMILPLLSGVALVVFGWEKKHNWKGFFDRLKALGKEPLPFVVLGLVVGYLGMMKIFGFVFATFVLSGLLCLLFGSSKKNSLLAGGITAVVLVVVFQNLLQVPLP